MDDQDTALTRCRQMVSDAPRLACYDALADGRQLARPPPKFEGRHNLVTDKFVIDRPTILRFRSLGVIFVMYLKDDKGEVVQNLHIGGVGEDEYLIDTPGTYFLQINGAEEWQIWLEPK